MDPRSVTTLRCTQPSDESNYLISRDTRDRERPTTQRAARVPTAVCVSSCPVATRLVRVRPASTVVGLTTVVMALVTVAWCFTFVACWHVDVACERGRRSRTYGS